ncbi:MAG: DUF3793 family protein [Synergistaceae bacterium]|nr:DUF3793 family protein [Synergistaceae bacterium]
MEKQVKESGHIIQTFMASIKSKETGEYIESLLACFAAPTIMGLKPGNLINLRRVGDGAVAATWGSRKEELLRKFKVEAFTFPSRMRGEDSGVLIMLYKKELLARAIFARRAWAMLEPLGYGQGIPSVDRCVEHLGERFKNDFPHEIGLFLGYPPEDVEGFIRNQGRGSLACGYWKVYGDVGRARETFRLFQRVEHNVAWSLIRKAAAAKQREA